jgi:Xaa-Pro aminopeptidase
MPYVQRQENVKQVLKSRSLDAFIIDDQTNLYYLTGLEMSAGRLLITTKNSALFVDNRYYEACQNQSSAEVFLTDKEPFSAVMLKPEYNFIKTLGFDSENTSYKAFTDLENLTVKLKEQSSGRSNIKLIALENPVKTLRMIKEPKEIELLKKAAILGSNGFDYVCSLLKTGVKEIEVSQKLEIFWKERGAKGPAFEPIIAFGKNSSMPHYRSGSAELKRGDVVLVDIGVNVDHYQSDMTRMVFFGQPLEQISVIHPIVQRAQQVALEICKPGTLIKDIDAKAREFIESQGYGENFTHGIGHGVGLDIHELPNMRFQSALSGLELKPGMVLTVEPGIYLPKIGGVRIEDTIVITDTGYESLTNRPTDPVIL